MKFKVGDYVRFKETGSSEFDGNFGRIIGHYAVYPEIDFVIVEIFFRLKNRPDRAVVMTTACLELADDDIMEDFFA